MVKAFYTCGIVMDVLVVFGELPEDILEKQKYAKWKAAYIHNCLKNGERPIPGPMGGIDNQNNADGNDSENNYQNPPAGFNAPPGGGMPSPSINIPQRPSSPPASGQSSRNSPPAGVVPGGFHPYVPPPSSTWENNPVVPTVTPSADSNNLPTLDAEQITKVKKYCKFASSAMDYDDNKTAVLNLQKALALLQTGRDPA